MNTVSPAAFVEKLARTPAPKDAANPFSYEDPRNHVRRHNLTRYLEQMLEREPRFMLIAEAPGYRGMRVTGVPFASRYHIGTGVMNGTLLGTHNGYIVPDDQEFPGYREQSATIVWNALEPLGVAPIHWASYPFHPHKPGQPLTNRKPRMPELELGREFLELMLEMFPVGQVIAVGNTGHEALAAIGMDVPKIRHPAQSGKNDFVAGINEWLGDGRVES